MFAVSITNKKTNIMNLAQKTVAVILTGLGIFLTINQIVNDFNFVL